MPDSCTRPPTEVAPQQHYSRNFQTDVSVPVAKDKLLSGTYIAISEMYICGDDSVFWDATL